MFSPAIGRAVRSTASISAAPASALNRTAFNTAQQPFIRPNQQRRLSSSKPSTPPADTKKKRVGAEKLVAREVQSAGKKADKQKKVADVSTAASAPTAAFNLPYVRPTDHLHEDEVKLSSFFSLHRPISIQHSWPEPTSTAEFDALFDNVGPHSTTSIQRTKRTLSEFIDRLTAKVDAAAREQPADAQQASIEVYHLDAAMATQQSVESWASRLLPFQPPPPPRPLGALAAEPQLFAHNAEEMADAINQRITEVLLPERPTFREHVKRRRGGMFLISVKRQRKLKMKKHKYKKLMKRTRLLRRKLDRL